VTGFSPKVTDCNRYFVDIAKKKVGKFVHFCLAICGKKIVFFHPMRYNKATKVAMPKAEMLLSIVSAAYP
jgi:hypothetical protein